MNIRKSMTAVGAALMVVGASSPALAFDCGGTAESPDPATISDSLVGLATYLRCADGTLANPGIWPSAYPIWQKRGAGSCEVQDSMAKKLNEEREFADGDKPPRNKNNTAAGAANDVSNGKYLSAVDKLDAFVGDAYKARLNTWDVPANGFENTSAAKMFLMGEIETARMCICKLTECE